MKNRLKFKVSEGCMKITPDGEKEKLKTQIINKYNMLLLYRIES